MTGGEFFGQFIDDYFAECDEHLATTRRVLLSLEDTSSAVALDPALLRELHRALHTLKGLAGMVGDAGAERVAHAMEDVLRAAEHAALADEAINALFIGADALDRCIAARRAGEPPPDIAPVIADLVRGRPAERRPSGPAKQPPASGASSPAGDDAIYLVEFVPSLQLSDRGISVDVVRNRLRELGTLLDARPRMVSGGVVFDFRVAVSAGKSPDLAWSGDGMAWSLAPSDVVATPVAAAPDAAPRTAASLSSVVRVDLSRLDEVMRMIANLVITRSRLDDVLHQMSATESAVARDALEETNALLERQIRRLREGVMRIRLVPVSEVFDRLRFAARDAIRESGKRVNLVFEGQTTEIDKQVVDRMLEPLLHVVRNAVIHGIESPAEREAAGKPVDGTVTLRAAASGDRILIAVEDDGRGIDADRVVARARARGLVGPHDVVGPDALLDLLCAPGLSTRDEADMTAGRGVGMDVVRNSVRALAGDLRLDTTPGQGTRFAIELPLTLMIVDALLVDVGGQHMAVPQPVLREIVQVESSAIVRFENNDVVPYRGGVLPIVRLARLFGIPETPVETVYLLVVGTDTAPMGLLVDRLLDLREIVVHPVTDPLVAMPGVGGATELGDGRVSLILDAAALLRLAHEQREHAARARAAQVSAARVRAARLPYQSN